jgi:sec-independent protein translocase protein TatB
MFNIGGGELLVIMLIALIVLGPQRLPDAARQIGKAMADLRRLSTGFQNEVRSALDTADDPNRVAARRNLLAKEAPLEPAESAEPEDAGHPPRTEPLVAGPPMEPRNGAIAPSPRPPTAQARAAAKKAAATNGAPVEATTSPASPETSDAEATKPPSEA